VVGEGINLRPAADDDPIEVIGASDET
jgi:hypothetical protein